MNRIFISPLAKRIAEEHSVNLNAIQGTGPRNRIVKNDILNIINKIEEVSESQKESIVSKVESNERLYQNTNYVKLDLNNVRKTIAERLTYSKNSIPHFYLRKKVKVDNLLEFRKQINTKSSEKISINDFIVKATSLALIDNPDANVIWNGDSILKFDNVDISIAVASNNGLMTPIIRSCETLSLSSISKNIKQFAEQANNGKLHPRDYTGGSFSISNLGMYGVDSFDAIINPPQSGILAIGALQKQCIIQDTEIKEESFIELSIAFDHRVIDGVLGAKMLQSLCSYIENPITILI